jgi:hypothetical protein
MPQNKWPTTPSDRRDRDRVVRLVRFVGQRQLVWTAGDLQRAAKADASLVLEDSSSLSRHVHALDSNLITKVEKRLDYGMAEEAAAASRTRHQFVLTARLPEYLAGGRSLGDLERVYCALFVAREVEEVAAVSTRSVTNVLNNVEALALVTARNTQNHLNTLSVRRTPLVQETKNDRWSLWHPIGPRPDYPEFDDWVAQYRAAGLNGGHATGAGHATMNAMAHEMVVLTARASRSSAWPAGRSVQVSDIRAAAGTDRRVQELNAMLQERRRTIGSVLGDLTKETIAGRQRVNVNVVKVGAVSGEAVYYDAPHEPGFDRRRLIVPFRQLQAELERDNLAYLTQEVSAATGLLSERSTLLRAIGACRMLTVHAQLTPIGALIDELQGKGELLGKSVREAVAKYRQQLIDFMKRVGEEEPLRADAGRLLGGLGTEIAEVLASPRPLMNPHEFAGFVSVHARGGLEPADFAHRVKALRRLANPEFVSQHDDDPAKAARVCFDRVEALCYLADRFNGRVYGFLSSGHRLMGRDLRSPTLMRLAAEDGTSNTRRAGLAGLVLLGDPAAVDVAMAWIQQSDRPDELTDAMYALLVAGAVGQVNWPDRVKNTLDRTLRVTLTDVLLASRTGRRLLQR